MIDDDYGTLDTPADYAEAAHRLGINPTKAEPGSQIWQCWADRVLEAWVFPHRREIMILEANAYAI